MEYDIHIMSKNIEIVQYIFTYEYLFIIILYYYKLIYNYIFQER